MSRQPWWMRPAVEDRPFTRAEIVRLLIAGVPIVVRDVRRDWKRAPR